MQHYGKLITKVLKFYYLELEHVTKYTLWKSEIIHKPLHSLFALGILQWPLKQIELFLDRAISWSRILISFLRLPFRFFLHCYITFSLWCHTRAFPICYSQSQIRGRTRTIAPKLVHDRLQRGVSKSVGVAFGRKHNDSDLDVTESTLLPSTLKKLCNTSWEVGPMSVRTPDPPPTNPDMGHGKSSEDYVVFFLWLNRIGVGRNHYGLYRAIRGSS